MLAKQSHSLSHKIKPKGYMTICKRLRTKPVPNNF